MSSKNSFENSYSFQNCSFVNFTHNKNISSVLRAMINRLIRLSSRVNSSIKSSASPLIWNGVVLHNHEGVIFLHISNLCRFVEKSESSDIVVRKYRTSPHFAIAYGRKGPQITKSSEEFLKQTDFPTAVYAIVPTREAAIKFVAHFAPDKEEIVHTNNLRKVGLHYQEIFQ